MRYLIILAFLIATALVCYGFYIKAEDLKSGELFIGLGVAVGFFLWMPLFLYHRWKGKSAKDYMLTNESFKKMREYEANRDREKAELRKKENKDA